MRESLEMSSALDLEKIDAQQARRVLDRLVGYEISPLLWKVIHSGLSAGRVQSVALRIICERDNEILAFEPQEYWSIEALIGREGTVPFKAKLHLRDGEKPEIGSGEEAEKIVAELRAQRFVVEEVKREISLGALRPPLRRARCNRNALVACAFPLSAQWPLPNSYMKG